MKKYQFDIFKYFPPLISFGIVLLIIWSSYNWAFLNKNVQISHIEITGNELVPLEEYQNLVLPYHGNSIFLTDLRKMTRIMEGHTNVQSARVSRKFPNRIWIEISERKPIAIVNFKPPLFLDTHGILFPLRGSFGDYSIPILSRFTPLWNDDTKCRQIQSKSLNSAKQFLQFLLDENQIFYKNISELRLNTDDDFEIILLDQPTKVVLGKKQITEKIKILLNFNEQLHVYQKRITDFKNLDLRFNSQIIAKEWI